MPVQLTRTYLFGGSRPWSPIEWTSSDDRVRGGSSQSYINASPFSPTAIFYGNLDTQTLGGAGFASQRTTAKTTWDLSNYDGILLEIEKTDGKKYTLVVKDKILPKRSDGRDQSTISWEYDFGTEELKRWKGGEGGEIFVPWEHLVATYRGREKKDTEPLNLQEIKRFSLMNRSFFDTQSGPFSISVTSISASKRPASFRVPYRDGPGPSSIMTDEKSPEPGQSGTFLSNHKNMPQNWTSWLWGGCFK